MPPCRIALVLGAGGARGVAHAGVLRRLRDEGIPIDAIVGCSVGAIVGAMYAAVRVEPEEMIEAAHALGPSSLLSYALSRWRLPWISRAALGRAGPIPGHLRRLERASFESLRAGIRRLGILTFDLKARREELFVGGADLPVPLPLRKTVAASAAIPGLFPPLCARRGERRLLLADAGWYTAVPIEHAFAPPVEAQKVIAVSLALRICLRQARRSYWDHLSRTCGDRLLVLRPSVQGTATILPRRRDIGRLVEAGERSVDAPALARIRSWLSESAGSARVS